MWGQGSSKAEQVWPSDSEPGHLPTTPNQGALAGSALWWGEHSASPSTASLCTAAVAAREPPPRAGCQHAHRKHLQTSSKSLITVPAAALPLGPGLPQACTPTVPTVLVSGQAPVTGLVPPAQLSAASQAQWGLGTRYKQVSLPHGHICSRRVV